ncbi:MAG: hypothetical protein LBE91_04225 [Tannerella sp.]|jgi:hypothetical protein|nr:hypothetical protein [Tannerella sp.]
MNKKNYLTKKVKPLSTFAFQILGKGEMRYITGGQIGGSKVGKEVGKVVGK